MRNTTAIFAFFLVGCANEIDPVASGILTVATIRDHVLIGYSRTLGTTGSFVVQSVSGGSISCEGKFRYPRPPDGTAYFDCSHGQSGSVRIRANGNLIGEGVGDSTMGEIHVVYGYSVSEMNDMLTLPKGTKLVIDDRGIGLVEIVEK